MKKTVSALLTAILFISCSNYFEYKIPSDGQYIGRIEHEEKYSEHNKTFCVIIENGLCTDFVIYDGTDRFNYYKPVKIRTRGDYPQYTYRINGFTIKAHFADSENFVADLSGELHTHIADTNAPTLDGEVYGAIALEANDIHFKLDNTALDADNNGTLDDKQNK